jgi:hypothetical protein
VSPALRPAHTASAAVLALALTTATTACSPVFVSRIGPPVPARDPGCELELLEEGQLPDRPYRDVGMVELDNCQDYRTPPCRTWLEEAACELGGNVIYPPQDPPPRNDFTAPLRFRLMVAAYVTALRPDPEKDIIFNAVRCDPPCEEDERCVGGSCKPAEDCDDLDTEAEEQPDRCVE